MGTRLVLTYHEVLPEPSSYLYRLTDAQFAGHLALLSSLIASDAEISLPTLTFDDGHRSNYEYAFSLLEEWGIKATFFVLAGCVGTSAKYISWNQAREMVAFGHNLQSHGWSHRLMTQCSSNELQQEVVQSKRELEDRLGIEVVSLSAPAGRWSDRVLDVCARAGYKHLLHSNPWTPMRTSEGIQLKGRLMVTGRMDPSTLCELLKMKMPLCLYARLKYGVKEQFRAVIGDRLYHRLWCWLANWNPEAGMEVEVNGHSHAQKDSQRP